MSKNKNLVIMFKNILGYKMAYVTKYKVTITMAPKIIAYNVIL